MDLVKDIVPNRARWAGWLAAANDLPREPAESLSELSTFVLDSAAIGADSSTSDEERADWLIGYDAYFDEDTTTDGMVCIADAEVL